MVLVEARDIEITHAHEIITYSSTKPPDKSILYQIAQEGIVLLSAHRATDHFCHHRFVARLSLFTPSLDQTQRLIQPSQTAREDLTQNSEAAVSHAICLHHANNVEVSHQQVT